MKTCWKANAQSGAASLTQLAMFLGMERSVLARNLKPLRRQGFATVSVGGDKRVRVAELTPIGRQELQAALLVWSKAHNNLGKALGSDDADRLIALLRKLAERLEGR